VLKPLSVAARRVSELVSEEVAVVVEDITDVVAVVV
jgi:hypothetical protein